MRHALPYDGEIAFADAQLGRLLDSPAERGRDRDLVIIASLAAHVSSGAPRAS